MYKIGETRVLTTRAIAGEGFVIIRDDVKCIELPSKRWAVFVQQVDKIAEAVKHLRENQYVKYFYDIGDNWHVSVTTGYHCVDFRRFYKSSDGLLKPTKDGIALRLSEWENMRTLVPQLDTDMAILVASADGNQYDYLREFLKFPEYNSGA